MPTNAVEFSELVRFVEEANVETLPGIVGVLAYAEAVARARMVSASVAPAPPPATAKAEQETWLTPQQAAAIPGVSVQRIYRWARGQRWASRLSRTCLRIDEAGFRRWLTSRR